MDLLAHVQILTLSSHEARDSYLTTRRPVEVEIKLITCHNIQRLVFKHFNLKLKWVNNVLDPTFIKTIAVRAPQSCVLYWNANLWSFS